MVNAVIGTSVPRKDGVERITGNARYTVDIQRPGMLFGKIKRSPHAHAKIVSIDTSKAEALPGVKAVLTVNNVPRVLHSGAPFPRDASLWKDQYIFDHKVRFVGEGVAAVAATSEEIAEEALELIEIEYEHIPAVFTIEHAMKPDAPRIHDTEQNLVFPAFTVERGDIEKGFAEADFIIEGVYNTGRPHPCYMEPNACVCEFDRQGRLTVWSSTQCVFMVRGIMAEVLDIPVSKVRVLVDYMGGGFGAKQDIFQHEFLCALLAQRTGRPVKIEYTRKETFVAGRSRHPVTVFLKQGFKKDGTITAREARYVSNTGGYASHGPGVTTVGATSLFSLYRCENVRVEGQSVYTNLPISGAFRGYGVVQAYFALDTQMDEIAERLGMDPAELKLKNAVREGDIAPSGHPIVGHGLEAAIQRGIEETHWQQRHDRKSDDLPPHIKRGWGMGTEMHGSSAYPGIKEQSNAIVKMNEDGSVHLLTGAANIGQGSHTAIAQIVAEELGVSADSVHVTSGDTDVAPFDIGAYASRTVFIGGMAAKKAAAQVKAQLLEEASSRFEIGSPDEMDIRGGMIEVNGKPMLSIKEVVGGQPGGVPPRNYSATMRHETTKSYSFAAHFVEVEVDTETGQVEIKQVVAVHEVGKAINPINVEGQIEGGIQQGIGHSLSEDYVIDLQTGRSLNASFVDYKMPLSMDMPPIKAIILEVAPDPLGPFGAKGVGEDPIIAIGPAIANAVYDAIGVRMRELPITPERVLQALGKF